ncbi:hypothetical protein NDN08_001459 [Rhodosorus marinus]|uniref:Alcohol dehydrogenase iron-type/glycerol dehydrogenase GldA domain-containing protein n=1 Tax=Rhodosorus marinus TaxID=101924 RepID=A0AAV8UWP6_9RHOD|nr:hypothetical protein NDN08_001459 [Rhodosorus marinus]
MAESEARFDPFKDYGSVEAKVYSSPHKYVQKKGLIKDFGTFLKGLEAEKAGIIGEKFLLDIHGEAIVSSLKDKAGVDARMLNFGGESSWQEVTNIVEDVKKDSIDFLVGFGGGKTIDTAKAAGYKLRIPVVIAPTLASNDAPCSALSVIYSAEGEFEEYFFFPDNPYIVLVDTAVVGTAPERFVVSGMGDAMATYYEADACNRAPHGRNMVGGRPTMCGLAIGVLCKDVLYEYGPQAAKDAAKKEVTDAVEKIIECNTLLSGLGFESGGLGAAHAIHNGMTITPKTHHAIHGEKVAFALVAQLVMEDNREEALRVSKFNKEVGLPYKLSELHLEASDTETLELIAKRSLEPGESIYNMPFTVTPQMVVDGMIGADELGISLD